MTRYTLTLTFESDEDVVAIAEKLKDLAEAVDAESGHVSHEDGGVAATHGFVGKGARATL